jgi:hypothetical protein
MNADNFIGIAELVAKIKNSLSQILTLCAFAPLREVNSYFYSPMPVCLYLCDFCIWSSPLIQTELLYHNI